MSNTQQETDKKRAKIRKKNAAKKARFISRITLYVPNAIREAIEKDRINEYQIQTMNAWVTDAIILKLKKRTSLHKKVKSQ